MLDIIFGIFIVSGIIFSIITCNNNMSNIILASGTDTLETIIKLFPLLALWLGIMNIAESSGLLNYLTKLLNPIIKLLFKNIPKDSKALEYIIANMVVTMFGLGNAATPFSIKAMKELKNISKSDKASDDMITFMILNTTGFTLIPTTVLSLRTTSSNPSIIIPICILVSILSLLLGIIINLIMRRINK